MRLAILVSTSFFCCISSIMAESSIVNIIVTTGNQATKANIFVNGEFVGESGEDGRLTLNQLEIGREYVVRAIKKSYKFDEKKIAIIDVSHTFIFRLEPAFNVNGTLIVAAHPGADEVYVDGVLNEAKLPLRLLLKHGKHKVKLVNKQLGLNWANEVDLKVGQILRVYHDFLKRGSGFVGVALKNAAEFGFAYVSVDGEAWPEKQNTTPLQIKLPVGKHTIKVSRDGFVAKPMDLVVDVKENETIFISFTLSKKVEKK